MPYAIRKLKNDAYRVYNKSTGKIYSKHTTLENAKKQLNLLEVLKEDPKKQELQIAIANQKTLVKANTTRKNKRDRLKKAKEELKSLITELRLGSGILDLALGDREATNAGNNINNQIMYYTRKVEETKQKKYIIDNNRQIVNLPYENEYDYQAPPFVVATNKKKSGYNYKLVNPVSKERNLASRKGENVIGLDRRAIPVPAIFHRDKENKLQRPELRDFSPDDREIIKRYDALIDRYEEQFNEGDFEEIPEIPFSNSERGRPCKLPKNCSKSIKRGKQGRLDITELTPTEEDKRAKKPLEPTTPYLRTTPYPRRSGIEYTKGLRIDGGLRQPEVYKHNQDRLAKTKKRSSPSSMEDELDYPIQEEEPEPEAKRTLEDFGIRLNNNTISKNILKPLIDYIKQGDFEDYEKLDAYIALIKKRKIKTPEGYKELVALAKKRGSGIKNKFSSNSIMPKFAKGSKEAKDYMASLRANRGKKSSVSSAEKIGGGFIDYLPANDSSQSQIADAYNTMQLGANGGKSYVSF